MTLAVGKVDGVFHRVLEHKCPQLEQHMNRPEGVEPWKKKLYGRCRGVLGGGETTVYRRRVSRIQVLEATQTCE